MLFYKYSHRERGLLWKAALGVSGPTTCTEEYFTSSSSMALQCKQGNMAHMNPLGLILSAFSPETMLCCNTDDTSSPGCWEKLRQGDWLLFIGGYMVFHNLRKVTQKGKKSATDIQKKTKKKKEEKAETKKSISVLLSTCSFNWSSSEKCTPCMFSTSPVLTNL